MIRSIKNLFVNITRRQIVSILVFLGVAIIAFLTAKYGEQVTKIGYVILFVEIAIIVFISWGMAGHTVMKVLFGVSVGLSLLIYLAQSYCDAPAAMRTLSGNTALMSLVGFGILYIGYDFVRSLWKEVRERIKTLEEINNKKKPWVLVIPYGLFTGLFAWQLVEVMIPIINSLCIYR